MTTVMDGKALAKELRQQIKEEAAQLKRQPGLAVVIVGEDPAAQLYVANKEKDCQQCNIVSKQFVLPDDTTEQQLLDIIQQLNEDNEIDGILIQLPLPDHINQQPILEAIAPDKDVDGFHPENVGRLALGDPLYPPCTPWAVMKMLKAYDIPISGKHCVVVGRSNIVGKPMAFLLLQENATVTICHSRTADLAAQTRQADILVSAVGKPGLITADMVKPGAVVMDVAINQSPKGGVCGDVDYEAVAPIAGYITPVPGGVGPVTRAMLLENILVAARRHQ